MSTGPAVTLRFDASRCDGYGMCSLLFPEHIAMDRWGFAQVDPALVHDPVAIRRARRAVQCCPKGALSLHTEGRPVGQGYAVDETSTAGTMR
jgi:ferredoxin